jgi:hypothetical protein
MVVAGLKSTTAADAGVLNRAGMAEMRMKTRLETPQEWVFQREDLPNAPFFGGTSSRGEPGKVGVFMWVGLGCKKATA